MKALVIARREFLGTRNLWIAAPLLGLFALGLPLLRGLRGQPAEDLRVVTVLGIGFGLCAVLGLILGAGLFAGDLAQKRAGFFLSRPVGSASLFFGKLLGSLLLVFLAGALVLAPLLLLRPAMLMQAWALPPGLLLTALTGLLVGHAGAIILRARSPWLLLDLVTLGGFATLVWLVQSSLMEAGAVPAFLWTGSALFAGALLALLLAGLLQVARGRGDLRAGHRVLSLTLAAGLLPLGAGGGLFAWKVLHPTPKDLRGASPRAVQPGGTWLVIEGEVWGYNTKASRSSWGSHAFLLDSASGRSLAVSAYSGQFSLDGHRYYWQAGSGGMTGEATLKFVDLAEPQLRVQSTGLLLDPQESFEALTADGSAALLRREERRLRTPDRVAFTVVHLQSLGRLGRWTMQGNPSFWALSHGGFLTCERVEGEIRYWRWDPSERDARLLWTLPAHLKGGRDFKVNGAGDRMLVWVDQDRGLGHDAIELRDGLRGTLLARQEPGTGERLGACFLAGGEALLWRVGKGRLDLSLLDRKGQVTRTHQLPLPQVRNQPYTYVRVREWVEGRCLIRVYGRDFSHQVDLDLASGTAKEHRDGILWPFHPERWFNPDLGGLWTRLTFRGHGGVHLRQPDGSLQRLTGPD